MLDNLKTDNSVKEDEDVLGGFGAIDSNVYDFTIDMAYMDKSEGGAISVNLSLKNSIGQGMRQTLWVTSGKAKGCKNYYETKQGEKRYLPGFSVANAMSLLSVGKDLSDLEPQEKVIKLYDFKEKKDTPQTKQVLVELLGKEITLGVIKQIVDKNAKNDAGVYAPTGETRTENEIDKVFRTRDHMTVSEIRAEFEEAVFYGKWAEKNAGTVRDKSTGQAGATAGASAATTGAAVEPKKSLFA